jgi:DNA-binding response OmpR family regulator
MALRALLLFGEFRREDLSLIAEAAEQAACSLRRADSMEDALSWLDAHQAHALICHSLDAEQLAVQTRSRALLSKLPVLALSDTLTDLDFASAFSWGADDVLPLGAQRPLLARLRALPKEAAPPPEEKRGAVLIAEGDKTRRTTVARVLRNAGFGVRFAVSSEDAQRFSADPELALVVTSQDLMPDARKTIELARSGGSRANFIVCSPPRDMRAQRAALADLGGVTVSDSFAAPENVLFVANELGSGRTNNRTSPRIPYGSRVAFRSAGREVDDHGFSYNVSEKGLYVRTLALPEGDEVWLELCPPRVERYIRVVGKIAWKRPFNYNESATVPPGFGVEIVDGAQKDRELWVQGYLQLAAAIG